MKITVIGASSGIGLEAVKRALHRKHTVTGLSRSAVQLIGFENFHFMRGDALKKITVRKAIADADAVLVALGTPKNMKRTTLFSDFAKILVSLHEESKTNIPFIIVSGFGAGESHQYVSAWYMKMFIKYLMQDVYTDKSEMEKIISSSLMNWIIVRPSKLFNNGLTENYRVETELFHGMNIGDVSRADVADYMVKQAENPTDLKKFAVLSAT